MTDKINLARTAKAQGRRRRAGRRYCNKDGGKPDLDALAELELIDYGQVRKELAERAGVTVAILDSEVSGRRRSSADQPSENTGPLSQQTARLTARIY